MPADILFVEAGLPFICFVFSFCPMQHEERCGTKLSNYPSRGPYNIKTFLFLFQLFQLFQLLQFTVPLFLCSGELSN